MIITTRRSSFGYAFDSLLTAMAWLGFSYLVARSVVLINRHYQEAVFYEISNFNVVIYYFIVTTACALAFLIWAHCRTKKKEKNVLSLVDEKARAANYKLPLVIVNEATQSRLTIIHHSNDGNIVKLENGERDIILPITKEII